MSRQLNRVSFYISIFVFVMGLTAILGQILNIHEPFIIKLSTPFSVLSILSSISLFLLTYSNPDDYRKLISRIFAIGIILISLTILINCFVFKNSAVDPESKVLFILIGLSLLCLSKTKSCIYGKIFIITIFIFSTFNLIGNLYEFDIKNNVLKYLQIDPSHSIVISIIAFGILAAREDEWIVGPILSKYAGGQMARRFLPIFIIILFVGLLRLKFERLGYYNVNFGTTVSTFINILIMFGSLFVIAKMLNKTDEIRQQTGEQLSVFRNLIDYANDAVYIIDIDSAQVVDVNQTACNMLGYSRSELLKLKVPQIDATPGFSWAEHAKTIKKIKSMMLNSVHKKRNGSTFPVEINIRYTILRDHEYIIALARDVSEKRKIESDLKLLNQQIEFILGVSKTGLDIIDEDFNIFYIDKKWAEVYGDPANKKCYEYFMGRDSVCPNCGVKKSLEKKQILITEELLPREGNRPIQVTSIPFKSESGKWMVAEVNVDITERKAIEETLRESEEKLRIMTEYANDVIFMVNNNGNIIFANKSAKTLFEYEINELLGKELSVILPKNHDKSSEFLDFFKDHNKPLSDRIFEISAKKKDGDIFPAEISISSIIIKGLINYVIILRDVTKHVAYRKALENRITETDINLEVTEEKYRALIENANDTIILVDVETGLVVEANPATEKLFGRSVSSIVNHPFIELHPKDKSENYLTMFKQTVDNKSGVLRNVEVVHSSGKKIPIQISYKVINYKNKMYIQGIMTDTTEYKNIEDTLTTQLAEARRLSDIGELAATVAHELRNPLGVIRTAAYNINRKADNPELSKHIHNIEKKIVESDKIIKNLLSYSRIKLPQYEKTNPLEILEQCILECKERYKDQNITISQNINLDSKTIIDCDPLQLNELLSNVIENAFQATITKNGTITINAQTDPSNNNIIFSVTDNGDGIDEADLKSIFNPFFTKKAKGIGLGLTVCRQVVNLHKGTIGVKSKINEGTTFTISLPINKPS